MIDRRTLERIAQRYDPQARLLQAAPLTGGISAQVMKLVLQRPNSAQATLLLRWHDGPYPHLVQREYHLLRRLHPVGLPVPRAHWLDTSGDLLPAPYILLDYVDGHTDFTPAHLPAYLATSAAVLATIHQFTPVTALAFLPPLAERSAARIHHRPALPDTAQHEDRIRAVLQAAWPWPQNPPGLLHGDYWPGNLIWRAGRLAAVIDWEDAALGDPLLDLAGARLEWCFAFGAAAMSDFTRRYLAHMPHVDATHLPLWDLYVALGPMHQFAEWAPGWAAYGRPDVTEATLRRAHRAFVEQALARSD